MGVESKPIDSVTGWTLIFLLVSTVGFISNGLVRHNWMLWASGALCAWLFIQILNSDDGN